MGRVFPGSAPQRYVCPDTYTLPTHCFPIHKISLEAALHVSACSRTAMLTPYWTGAPLARSWDPFHTKPKVIFYDERHTSQPRIADNGVEHYRLLIRALAEADKKLRALSVLGMQHGRVVGLPLFIFNGGTKLGCECMRLATVIPRLETFELHLLSMIPVLSHARLWPDIGGLSELLGSMTCLKHLDLSLPENCYYNPPSLYPIKGVFPKTKSWPTLESLILHNIATTADDLLHLLTRQMPSLKQLRIGGIFLETGTWVKLFQNVAQSKRLHSVKFDAGLLCCYQSGAMICELPTCVHRGLERLVTREESNSFHLCADDEHSIVLHDEYCPTAE